MKPSPDRANLLHMRDAITRLEKHLEGVTYQVFLEDWTRQDAILRQLEIMGKIARNFTEEFRERHVGVPWRLIIGMRHRLAHDYEDIDLPTVWDTVTSDIAPLKAWVRETLAATQDTRESY